MVFSVLSNFLIPKSHKSALHCDLVQKFGDKLCSHTANMFNKNGLGVNDQGTSNNNKGIKSCIRINNVAFMYISSQNGVISVYLCHTQVA